MESAMHLVVLLVLAPVLEEVVFRAGLQESLIRRWPQHHAGGWPNTITTLVFGVAHLIWRHALLGLAVLLPAWLIGQL